uniref:HEAT repeat-containing protein 5B n=1 Tax=Kalanchoe fedtschenkoi TaxID=63787 RepID=A0A7N0VMZ5_KALFE
MAKKTYVRDNVPLSRFGVLVAQLESIVASAVQQPPDALLCFDLLSDLLSAIDEEPRESVILWQRKCEDALYSLLILGARRPVRHLASAAMARIIGKGDSISIYSRTSTLQGFLSDGKRSEPLRVAGAAQCLGELYSLFGRRITSGLLETANIAAKLMKFHEDFVRQEALNMLQNALEGSGGNAAISAYIEAFRFVMRSAITDKSVIVRVAAARCLNAFANIGGPGLGMGELDSAASSCVKALEDPATSVRDAFAEALGAILALGMNTNAQVQVRGKGQALQSKALDGGLQRHLLLPFMKAAGARSRLLRIGLTFSWVSLLQAIRTKQLRSDVELQNFALQAMGMLRSDGSIDAQALACVLYILRVGIIDQLTEPTQRAFLVFLAKQLQSSDINSFMEVAALRTISYLLKILGEVPFEFKEVLDNTVVAAVYRSSMLVRIEAALTLRTVAEVDPTCVAGLVSFGATTINALRENLSFEKGHNLKIQLDSLHGQATVLAALVSVSPKLPLGYPSRLPKSVLQLSKAMLTEYSRNPEAAGVEEQAGWNLLSSLLSSMPKEELKDQVFDVLTLWAPLFGANQESELKNADDLLPRVNVFSAAIEALTSFIRSFFHPHAANTGVLLQPVLFYLSRAISYTQLIAARDLPNIKPAVDVFIIRTLTAYRSLPDPLSYKTDHTQIIQICSSPFRDPSGYEESSSLSALLDKRDAWLGPLVPGRDWFEDELRAFQGGTDGLMPCVWDDELSSFPQPETVGKTLVNQMLLCFGMIFASQDNAGILSILGMIDQCLKNGKKQPWRSASVTNICVGLLAGLKALLSLRSRPLGSDLLLSVQAIFQGILVEGEATTSQRRAASECLGLIARLGDDMFTARMTRLLLGDLTNVSNSNYNGSIAVALGCIHHSAGGMALSSLVPLTVTSISSLARSPIASLQTWSLHGLLLTIEAAGLSYVSHVQEALGLALDILLHDDNGWVDLQQGVGRLINAIVAVLGPELSPGSIFFSRCKSIIAEISSCQETATFLESVRFTQQLILFAPQAVSVQTHVRNLQRTLTSRQPILRRLAVSTIKHLVEKDPDSIISEQIEDSLFHMLDEETDSEITNLVRNTLMRLLYASCPSCPSHWICICRNMVLATSSRGNPGTMNNVERDNLDGSVVETIDSLADDETMVSSHEDVTKQNQVLGASRFNRKRGKHLRFRTRTFAAECLRHLLKAVGNAPAHFDLSLAREAALNRKVTGDWLVLHVHELISLAYQISTIQHESMQPIGVEVLSAILDKFEMIEDPELPGHLLLEQYQAQLVSACRTALDASSGPILLEAGLRLATKILTSGIISGDQASVKRIYSLISRPLEDFKDLYYPSFAEWVSCKIKIRLLAAHASLKCYSYTFLKKQHGTSNEYSGLIPLLSKSSSILGKYWMLFLRDYIYICFGMHHHKTWMPFLEGIQSPFASDKLISCLEEAWPVVFQAVALDAIPATSLSGFSNAISESSYNTASLSGYNMVALEHEEYQLVCGFALLVLFQWQHPILDEHILPASALRKFHKGSSGDDINVSTMKLHEIVLPVLQFLSTEKFFKSGFLNLNFCQDLVKMLTYFIDMDNSWHSLAVPVFLQIVQNCPEEFLSTQNFLNPVIELCAVYLLRSIKEIDTMQGQGKWNHLMTPLFSTAKALVTRLEPEKQLKSLLVFLLIGFECCKGTSESNFSAARDFICHVNCLFNNQITDSGKIEKDSMVQVKSVLGGCLFMISKLTKECTESIYTILNQMPKIPKLLQMKQAFYLELAVSYAQLAYRIVLGKDCGGSDLFFWSCLKHSVAVFQTTITDSNLQVRAIALHVLYSLAQKGSASKSSFYLFFMCELSGAIFSVLTSMLKKPVAKEKMAIVGECVRLLVLLHSLAKDSECERGLINLLLEGIVLVLSASEDDLSPEIVDVRNLSIKIVSHLAQLPSSAALFKDALLTMPVSRRQRLQVIIRESVTKNQGSTQPVSSNSPLIIKLPAQPGVGETIHHPSDRSGKEVEEEVEVEEEEEEEEEDDWDAFQSFPATTAPNADSEAESNESTSVQSVHVTTAPNKDSQSESAEDPKQLNDVKDEDCEALKSPSTASNSGPEGESPTQVSDIKNKDSGALNSPSSATNSDSEAKSPMQVHDSKNEDIKALKCPSNASNSDPEAKSSKQVNNFKNEDSEALKSPSIASSSEPEAKSDLEEPSPVDNVKTNSNESLQSTPMAPTPKLNSEGGFNTAGTTPVDDFMNDSSKNYSGSAPGDSIMQIADEEPEKASNELVLSESRISAIEVAEASPSAKEDHPISHANITHDESNGL